MTAFASFDGHPTCDCMTKWLPAYYGELERRGLPTPVIYQLTGSASQSAGTHAGGGAADFHPMAALAIWVARQMGLHLCPRFVAQGFSVNHDHGLLRGCPHLSGAAVDQFKLFDKGEDGLLDHAKDTGPADPGRTWEQGIAWAEAQSTAHTQEAPMTTYADSALSFRADTMTNDEFSALCDQIRNAGHSGLFAYLSPQKSKNMTPAHVQIALGKNLAVPFVWEDGALNALQGATQGKIDATEAVRQAKANGNQPGDTVFATCDHNGATPAQVEGYAKAFVAIVKAAGFVDGGYGPDAFIQFFTIKWRVETWGTASAHVIQQVNHPVNPVPGCDINTVVHDFPHLKPGAPRLPAPARPDKILQAQRHLVIQISNTPASDEWGRRARIANNALRGTTNPGIPGKTQAPPPAHVLEAMKILAVFIVHTPASDAWGHRARIAYNALNGIH